MTTHLVSFGTGHYAKPLKRLQESATPWFDELHIFDERGLGDDFKTRHQKLLRYRRGYGFWIWKPWVILTVLKTIKPGDVLMYSDSQMIFMENPNPLFRLCQKHNGVLLFHQKREGHLNRTWTRRDTFIKMGCDLEMYWNGPQLNAATSVWSPTNKAIRLVEEWYAWCSDEQVVSDAPSTLGDELPEFKDSRQDQSVLSLLAMKYGLATMPDPTQFGNGYAQEGRNYRQILKSDRMVGRNYPVPDIHPVIV